MAAMLMTGRAVVAQVSAPAPVDYAQPSAWLCLPGRQDACATDLDAIAFDAAGHRTPKPFKPAADPPVDCFYVYPTVSREPGPYADMTAGPEEVRVVQSQAARFSAKCRLYAPIYRQMTTAGLTSAMHGGMSGFALPYGDVLAAWRTYLARYNKGRGVILIGHSQGSMHLTRLLADEIDGKPAQKLLVAAYLAGDSVFAVPKGKDVGGTLNSIPLCRAAAQFGCVLVWSSYAETDTDTPRFFGRNPGQEFAAPCTNPAALAGGRAPLDGYTHKPAVAPAEDPPWVEMAGQLSGECVSDTDGTVLRVRVEPGPYAPLLNTYLRRANAVTGWGLHAVDIGVVEGDLLNLAESQAKAWAAAQQPGSR